MKIVPTLFQKHKNRVIKQNSDLLSSLSNISDFFLEQDLVRVLRRKLNELLLNTFRLRK